MVHSAAFSLKPNLALGDVLLLRVCGPCRKALVEHPFKQLAVDGHEGDEALVSGVANIALFVDRPRHILSPVGGAELVGVNEVV